MWYNKDRKYLEVDLETDEFPGCCAFTVVCNFPEGLQGYDIKLVTKGVDECLAEIIEEYKDDTAGLFVNFTEWQHLHFGKLLKKKGFEEFFRQPLENPKTHNKIHAYFLDLHPRAD